MTTEPHLILELEQSEAFAETTKTLVLPWSGQSVTIRVPAGTPDATMMRLPGLGPAGADGTTQDAFVQVRIKTVPAQFGSPPTQLGPPQFGPGQPGAYPPPVAPGAQPARRKSLLIGGIGLVVVLLLCCGLPLSFFFLRDDEKPLAGPSVPSGSPVAEPSVSLRPVSADEYQALLADVDKSLTEGFAKLGGAKNPKAVQAAVTELETTFYTHEKALGEIAPPEPVATANTNLVAGLVAMSAALSEAKSAAGSGDVCLGPSAVAQVSRESAADQLRAAAQALATADPSRAYQVGSFVPKETKDGNTRLSNGTFVKRTRGGLGQLKIENGGTDAVINLVKSGSKTPAISVYVRGKGKFTVNSIKDGTYTVFMTSGKDWNKKLKGFSRDCNFQKFDDSFKFTTTSRTYTGWTITLTPVAGGNASTSDVDPGDFPAN